MDVLALRQAQQLVLQQAQQQQAQQQQAQQQQAQQQQVQQQLLAPPNVLFRRSPRKNIGVPPTRYPY